MATISELEAEKQILHDEMILLEETATSNEQLERIEDIKISISDIDNQLMLAKNREREFKNKLATMPSPENLTKAPLLLDDVDFVDIDPTKKVYEILLVEDSEADARLAREALSKCDLHYNLSVVSDGVETLSFLRKDTGQRLAVIGKQWLEENRRLLAIEDPEESEGATMQRMTAAKEAHEKGTAIMKHARREDEKYKGAQRPDIILLDLNMQRKDGRQTLVEIKEDSHLRSIPVIVLTTSSHDRDVFQAYNNYANAYVVKPRNMAEYITAMKRIVDFWLKTATHLLR